MRYSFAILAAAVTLVSAQDDSPCRQTYEACLAAGTPEVACGCDLQACVGQDNARAREFCASATANLPPRTSASSASSSAPVVTGTIVQPSGAPQVTAPAGSLALGEPCGADEQCQGGAQCFGSTAGTIRTCGSFNAACSSDSQCATNTCQDGLCNGFLPSQSYLANTASRTASSASSVASSATSVASPAATTGPGPMPAPNPPVLAPEGSIRLGDLCSDSIQCANGADCFGSNSMVQLRCGNFNAACSQDSQCAFNTCNNGLCNGFRANATTVATSGIAAPTGSGAYPSTSSPVPYTGDASVVGALSGVAAIVAGVAAWVM